MRAGIEDEARRGQSLGVEFIYRPVPKLGENEKHQVTALLREKLNAVVIVPGNPRVVAPLIDRAEASGVRVVCVSTDTPLSCRSTVVCVNPELNGRLAAELMAKFVPPQADVAIITGMLATEDHRKKIEGFQMGFSAYSAGGRVVAVFEAHESEEESYKKTYELLVREKQLCGIYVNTVNCLPVCRAVHEHGRSRQLRLITTDLFQQMVPLLQKCKSECQEKTGVPVLISGIRIRNSVVFHYRKLRYSERRKSSTCCCCVLFKPLNAPTEPQASLGGTTEVVIMQ